MMDTWRTSRSVSGIYAPPASTSASRASVPTNPFGRVASTNQPAGAGLPGEQRATAPNTPAISSSWPSSAYVPSVNNPFGKKTVSNDDDSDLGE